MSRKYFRIVTFSLLFAGLAIMIGSIFVNGQTTKTIMLGLTAMFYLAAGIQIVIYKGKPKVFDDKSKFNGN